MRKIFTWFMSMLILSGVGYNIPQNKSYVVTVADSAVDGNDTVSFNLPMGVFSGNNGELYVLDTYNNLIHKINVHGDASLFAGEILMLDTLRLPRGFYNDGILEEALFNRPTSGVMDASGRIFIADRTNHAIRMIADGYVYTFAGGEAGYRNGQGSDVMFYYPTALAMDRRGNLFIADTGNNAIRRIAPNGHVTTVAGVAGEYGFRDGIAGQALFNQPMGIAVRFDGVIIVADSGNHLIRTITGRRVDTLAGVYQLPEEKLTEDEQADDWVQQPIGGFADGAPSVAMFNIPMGLALWRDKIIVADSVNHAIRAILPTGEVITITGTGYPGYIGGSVEAAYFHLPQAVYILDDKLVIVDTGNNMIRILALTVDNLEAKCETSA